MEITELKKQLHSQESEYKSLVRSGKVSIKPWLVCLMLTAGMLFGVLLIMATMVQVKEHLEATRGPMRAWMWL